MAKYPRKAPGKYNKERSIPACDCLDRSELPGGFVPENRNKQTVTDAIGVSSS